MFVRACASLPVCVAIAQAQEGTATWLWDVTTQDGDALVESGETATVTLSLFMQVDGIMDDDVTLSAGIFDTIGGANASNGAIKDWEVLSQLDGVLGDLTTTDGVSLFNTNLVNCFGLNMIPCTTDNPIDVLAFEWETNDYSKYTVEYATSTKAVGVWIDVFGDQEHLEVNVNEAAITFAVVPAPSLPAAVALAVCADACRGCRRRNSLPVVGHQ